MLEILVTLCLCLCVIVFFALNMLIVDLKKTIECQQSQIEQLQQVLRQRQENIDSLKQTIKDKDRPPMPVHSNSC